MNVHPSTLTIFALSCAALAAALLVAYVVIRPDLVGLTKVWLLVAIGVLPVTVAVIGNVEGFEATKERTFCGSCHVMTPHANDSNDPTSASLASRHARNALFGSENCYACHADYGMYGTVVTKLGGMRHVWLYVTEYRNTPIESAKQTIHLVKPYPNENCMQCHSTRLDLWSREKDHKSSLDDVRAGRVSCASAGCHGYAHPFWKTEGEKK
jgi:cytochrome c-type protein NapC